MLFMNWNATLGEAGRGHAGDMNGVGKLHFYLGLAFGFSGVYMAEKVWQWWLFRAQLSREENSCDWGEKQCQDTQLEKRWASLPRKEPDRGSLMTSELQWFLLLLNRIHFFSIPFCLFLVLCENYTDSGSLPQSPF